MTVENRTPTSKDNATTINVNKLADNRQTQLDKEISRRAFDLYKAGGSRDGNDLSHWYQAESQILKDIPEIRESGAWYSVNVPIPEARPESIHVDIDPHRAVIALERSEAVAPNQSGFHRGTNALFYLVARWKAEVDPSTASAYVKNETLVLSVKQAKPA